MSELKRRVDAAALIAKADTFFYRRAYDVTGGNFGPPATAEADAADVAATPVGMVWDEFGMILKSKCRWMHR